MPQPDNDDLVPRPEKLEEPVRKAVAIRFDEEHYAALIRVSEFEKLNVPDTIRKLVRIADQMVSGADSPFASRLEHLLLPRKKAG